MTTGRLEAFSDGVLAIIITIMVLGLKPPAGASLGDLGGRADGLLTYLLSFAFVGIYWNNHHHMFQLAQKVDGRVLWANLALLFWLSLLPFTTGWIDETHFARTPVVVYGVNLLLAGAAYFVLERMLLRLDADGALAHAHADDVKGRISPFLYITGIALAFVSVWLAIAVYAVVALMWIVPDPRIERATR